MIYRMGVRFVMMGFGVDNLIFDYNIFFLANAGICEECMSPCATCP